MFIYIIFFLFSLGQIARISLSNGQVNFYLYELFILVFFITLFLKNKFKPIINYKSKFKFTILFLFWLLITHLISSFEYSIERNIISFLYLLRTSFYIFFIVYSYKLFSNKLKTQISKGILLFIFLTAIFSIIQYFLYPNLRNLLYLGWDPHQYRMFGTFLDTSISATLYGMILLYLFFNLEQIRLEQSIKKLLIILYSAFGLLTYSRAFYISIFIVFSYFFISKKKFIYVFLFLIIFTFGVFFLPKLQGESTNLKRVYSISARFDDYKEGLTMLKKSPIWGYGYNRLMFVREINKSENKYPNHSLSSFQSSPLTILVSSGIIGLILFIFSLTELWNINRISKYFILFLFIFSLMDNVFLHPFALFLLLFFISDS